MELVVPKPQNLLEQLRLVADSPPTQGCSFIFHLMTKASETDTLPGRIVEAIRTNGGLQEITIAESIEEKGRMQYRGNLYVPRDDELRLGFIQKHQDTALARHQGRVKMCDLLDWNYDWKVMQKDVDKYVRNCLSCQSLWCSHHSTFGVLWPFPAPDTLWEDMLMDLLVELPECEGFDAIWVVVDRLSKMGHFIPRHMTIDALGLAELCLKEVVRLHGLPLTIVSDREPQFGSTFWQQICNRLGIDRRMSTAYHPQTAGQMEQLNASIEQYHRVIVNHQQDDWVKWLLLAEFAAHNGTSGTTTCAPFVAVHGVDPRTSFIGEPTKEPDHRPINADQVQAIIQQVDEQLQVEMTRSQAAQEERTNRARIAAPNVQKGSQGWLDARHIRTTRPTHKLDWKGLWPWTAVHRVSQYAYKLVLPASLWIQRPKPVSHLVPMVDDPLEGQRINQPPPVEVEGEEEY